MNLLDLLLEPMSYPFMQRGLAAAIIVGVVCAVVGTYVVLRGMAFFGDALSHTILPGVALGYILSGGALSSLFVWGLGTAVLASFAIGFLTRNSGMKEDTAIGLIFAGTFALGVLLMSTVKNYAVDLTHLLFGNVLGVSNTTLWFSLGAGALVLTTIVLFYKELLVTSFDPTLAETIKLPVRRYYYLLLVLVAVTVVVSLQTVGTSLVLAMLLAPSSTALLLTRRLPLAMTIGAAIGAFSSIVGLYISYYLDIASGATIVLVTITIFLLAFLFAPERGLVWRLRTAHAPGEVELA